MDENIKMEDLIEALPSDAQPETTEIVDTEPDPLKQELERVQKRTKEEKLEYTLKRVQKQLDDLRREKGFDPEPDDIDEDDKPVTLKMLREMQVKQVQKTAVDLADSIANETERELVKYHIENTINPSGDPETDLKNARILANAVRNQKILDEYSRKTTPPQHSGGSSAPANPPKTAQDLSRDDAIIKQWGGLSDDEVTKILNR